MAFLKANIAELRCRSVGLWSKNEASTANLYNDYHSALKKKKKKSARSAAKSLDCGVSMTMLF